MNKPLAIALLLDEEESVAVDHGSKPFDTLPGLRKHPADLFEVQASVHELRTGYFSRTDMFGNVEDRR
jgi:hypothetical protein